MKILKLLSLIVLALLMTMLISLLTGNYWYNLGYWLLVCLTLGMTYKAELKTWKKKYLDAHTEIRLLIDKHKLEEDTQLADMENKLKFYEKEFNINPLSWRKRKKK